MSISVLREAAPVEPVDAPDFATHTPITGRERAAIYAAAVRAAEEALHLGIGDQAELEDLDAAETLLEDLAERLSAQLISPGVRAIRIRDCADSLVQVQGARVEIARSRAQRTTDRQRAIGSGLRALRGAVTVEQLLKLVPIGLCRCGFTRAWVSTLDGTRFQTAAFHGRSLDRAAEASDAGELLPQALSQGSHETEMVRLRRPVLVGDTAAHGFTEPVIEALFAPRSYVAAPVIVDTRVIAFVHADRPGSAVRLCSEDREVLAVFTEGFSHALQRVMLGERLERLRGDVRQLTSSVGDMLDNRCCEPLALTLTEPPREDAGGPAAIPTQPPATAAGAGPRLAGLLTSREIEVLRLMAAGETNASIAKLLVISEGTVKSHVKNLLRKLHATNRAQAVARYYRVARGDDA